ncbi:MAG: SH3 domain-containing protein [Pseudomonadota bacterium]
MKSLALMTALLMAASAVAQSVRNQSGGAIDLRAGPADWFPVVAQLQPGGRAEMERCDVSGDWCLTWAEGTYGWLDTRTLQPAVPLAPPSAITVMPLPADPGAARPLPPEILDAIPPEVPDARAPLLLSVTEPVRNVTDGPINLRVGPGTDRAVIDQLQPGEGGVIDMCTPSEQWCRIARPGGPSGWVKTTLIGLRRL